MIPAAFTARLGIILKSAFQHDFVLLWSNLVYMLGSLRCGELFMWPFGIESLAGRSLMVGRHTLMAGGYPARLLRVVCYLPVRTNATIE